MTCVIKIFQLTKHTYFIHKTNIEEIERWNAHDIEIPENRKFFINIFDVCIIIKMNESLDSQSKFFFF